MKKVKLILLAITLAAILAVAVAVFTLPAGAKAEGDYTYTVSLGEANITDVDTSISGDVTVPSTLGGYPVTSIGYFAFEDCSGLTSITIPDGVTSIGDYVFYNCTGLTSITISDDVTSIGEYAFYNCEGLTSITIPDGVTSIGRGMFYNCTGLTSITIPDGVTSIGRSAFIRCLGLASITIPDSVTSIGDFAFDSCSGLTSITIPDSVTSIGEYAFYGCSRLTSITIPFVGASKNGPDNTHFGYIFGASLYSYNSSYVPKSLKTVVITGDTSIGEYAFYGCEELTSITIPDSVTSIGTSAFFGCTGLTSIQVGQGNATYHSAGNCLIETATKTLVVGCKASVIPTDGSVTSIGEYAFYGCTGLTSITIPDSVTSIGTSAFSGCSGLTSITIPFVGASKNGPDNTHFGYIFGASLYSYNSSYVPKSLKTVVITGDTSIGEYAFYGCEELTSITIPDSVTSIGTSAFFGCTGLTSITIPDSVTSIGEDAFCGCTGLTSVTIGNGVTSIGEGAFEDCTRLTSIIIPDSVTSIGEDAFCGCTGLTSVTIGNGVTSIGEGAFEDCTRLTSIIIPDSVTSIGEGAFEDCTRLTSIIIPDSVTSIGASVFYGCSVLTYNEYNNAYYLGNATNPYVVLIKAKSTNITSCEINSNTKIIYGGAFYGCTGLTSITIPDSVTSIGASVFYGCSVLTYNEYNNAYYLGNATNPYVVLIKAKSTDITSCEINSNTKIIYGSAFADCRELTSIAIPDSVTSIGDYAFYYCTGLTSITIPDSVTSIGEYAFSGCSGLTYNEYNNAYYCGNATNQYVVLIKAKSTDITSCEINSNTKIIYGSAFYGCIGLTSITIPNSVTSIGEDAFYGSGLEKVHCLEGSVAHAYAVDNDINVEFCSVGVATCTAKAACSICEAEYGEALGHDFSTSMNDTTHHWTKCSRCDEIDGKAEHAGGTATCTAKAACLVCEAEYGEALGHDFSTSMNDTTHHWTKCSRCDEIDGKAEHTLGTDNKCTDCTYQKAVTPDNNQGGEGNKPSGEAPDNNQGGEGNRPSGEAPDNNQGSEGNRPSGEAPDNNQGSEGNKPAEEGNENTQGTSSGTSAAPLTGGCTSGLGSAGATVALCTLATVLVGKKKKDDN